MKLTRPVNNLKCLPAKGLIAAAAVAGVFQSSPALALGGGVTLSQNSGVTTVNVNQAYTTSRSGNLTNVSLGLYDIEFKLASAPTATAWSDLGSGLYAYSYEGTPDDRITYYTALTGDILSGAYTQNTSNLSSLTVFSNGVIEFTIASDITDNPPCYMNVTVNSASPVSGCNTYANVLNLTVYTGKTGFVPNTSPVIPGPTIESLLTNFTGTAYFAKGSISTGGSEGLVTFTSRVPSPFPIAGAALAFGFSRRLRQRIIRSKASAGSHQFF